MTVIREAMLNDDKANEVRDIQVEPIQLHGHESLIYANIVATYMDGARQILMRFIPKSTAEQLAQGLRDALEEINKEAKEHEQT